MLTLLSIAIAFLFLSGNKQPKKVATQKGSLKDIMYIAGTIGLLRALQYSIFNGDVSLEFGYFSSYNNLEVFHIFSFHKKAKY